MLLFVWRTLRNSFEHSLCFPLFSLQPPSVLFDSLRKEGEKGSHGELIFRAMKLFLMRTNHSKLRSGALPFAFFSDDSSKRGRGAKAMRQGTEKEGLLQFAVCCSKRRVAVITCFLSERGKSSAERMSCLYFFSLKAPVPGTRFHESEIEEEEDFVVSWRHSGKRHKS